MPEMIGRRELLKIATATFAGLMGGRLSGGIPAELVENVAKDAGWTPGFFTVRQDETVAVLTDLLIPRTDTPGARDAKVHRYIDLFMAVKKPAEQKEFVDGLNWLDEYARQTYQKEFAKCSEAEQTKLLTEMAGDDKAVSDTGHAFFRQAKSITTMIYFNTPEGYKELNKFGPPTGVVAGTVVQCH